MITNQIQTDFDTVVVSVLSNLLLVTKGILSDSIHRQNLELAPSICDKSNAVRESGQFEIVKGSPIPIPRRRGLISGLKSTRSLSDKYENPQEELFTNYS